MADDYVIQPQRVDKNGKPINISNKEYAEMLLKLRPHLTRNNEIEKEYFYLDLNHTGLYQRITHIDLVDDITTLRLQNSYNAQSEVMPVVLEACNKIRGGGGVCSFSKELDNFNIRDDYEGYYTLPLFEGLCFNIKTGKVSEYDVNQFKYTDSLPLTATQLEGALKTDFDKTKLAQTLLNTFRNIADLKVWIRYVANGLMGNQLKKILIMYSAGNSGTTELGTLNKMIFKNRFKTLEPDLFNTKVNKSEYDLANCKYANWIYVRELDEKAFLNVSLAKSLVGNDDKVVKQIWQKPEDIYGRFNITFNVNSIPKFKLKKDDNSLRERFIGYQCNTIPDDKRITDKEKLLNIFRGDLHSFIAEVCKQAHYIYKELKTGKSADEILGLTDNYKNSALLIFGEATGIKIKLDDLLEYRQSINRPMIKVFAKDLKDMLNERYHKHSSYQITSKGLKDDLDAIGVEYKPSISIDGAKNSGYDLTNYISRIKQLDNLKRRK